LNDSATAGIWERVIPNPTYDENNEIVQPGSDHSLEGTACFVTGNSSDENNPGQSDVDGGTTTLFSPIYDLSSYDNALVSYWKWYTNNQGNNPETDMWLVDISGDGGNSWISLENTSNSNNYWLQKQFIVSDYIELSNQVQFRFIAQDTFNDGDSGSGGSLIEAGLDDFKIEIFEDNSCIAGDLNLDLSINIQDIVLMVNLIVNEENTDNYLCSGDINTDSMINIQDIILVISLILD
jgi:hypothetical protein